MENGLQEEDVKNSSGEPAKGRRSDLHLTIDIPAKAIAEFSGTSGLSLPSSSGCSSSQSVPPRRSNASGRPPQSPSSKIQTKNLLPRRSSKLKDIAEAEIEDASSSGGNAFMFRSISFSKIFSPMIRRDSSLPLDSDSDVLGSSSVEISTADSIFMEDLRQQANSCDHQHGGLLLLPG